MIQEIMGGQVTLIVVILYVLADFSTCQSEWPVPYRRFPSRPKFNSYCHAGVVPFCPTGERPNSMPEFKPTERIEVYALKAPVFEFKFGDLLGKFHIMHDAIGFHNLDTGLNYTLEWYELVELFNCTFAHVLKNDSVIWCNQGAACIYDGLDKKHWQQNGTFVKVAEITGDLFDKFAEWVLWDNRTAIYYQTWTVEDKPGGKMWFDAFDCASFVLRAFQELANLGTKFNQSVHLNYTRIHLYSDEPQYLGEQSLVLANNTLANEIKDFYRKFQSHQNFSELVKHMLEAYSEIFVDNKYYFFYNYEYWFLPMKSPYIKLTYYEVQLPLPNQKLKYKKYGEP